jgi:hypothetical protein
MKNLFSKMLILLIVLSFCENLSALENSRPTKIQRKNDGLPMALFDPDRTVWARKRVQYINLTPTANKLSSDLKWLLIDIPGAPLDAAINPQLRTEKEGIQYVNVIVHTKSQLDLKSRRHGR